MEQQVTEFYLPSEKLVKVDSITQVDESQRFVQLGDGNSITLVELLPDLTGAVQAFAGESASNGWLLCDGREVALADYPKLGDYLKTTYGTPTDPLNFKLPDLRGYFIRGLDTGASIDSGRAVGSKQVDTMQRIIGKFRGSQGGTPSGPFTLNGGNIETYGGGSHGLKQEFMFDSSQATRWDANDETRPKNIAMNYFIHY